MYEFLIELSRFGHLPQRHSPLVTGRNANTLKLNNPGSALVQWQRQMERELLLLIPDRTLGFNGSYLRGYFAFGAGNGGFFS